MKRITSLLLLCLVLGCKGTTKEEASSNPNNTAKVEEKEVTEFSASADYSSLFNNYTCDMSVAELAKVLKIPESDLSIAERTKAGNCYFDLKGFGKYSTGGDMRLIWGATPSSKRGNKKAINSYLQRKKEGLKIMGMDIELAKTGDCYLTYQPAYGRMIIYNENYDTAFLMDYGQKIISNDRTAEQHEALRLKMTDLANYLLKKHRK